MLKVLSLSDYPEWLTQKFLLGDLNVVCMAYRLPAVMTYKEDVYVINTRVELLRVLATYQALMTHSGMTDMRMRIANTPAWFSDRFDVVIEHSLRFGHHCAAEISRMCYQVERKGIRPAIRMVRIEQMPFAEKTLRQKAISRLKGDMPSAFMGPRWQPQP